MYTHSLPQDDARPRESGVDRTTRREIEMEEAGMKLNYKHRKLQGGSTVQQPGGQSVRLKGDPRQGFGSGCSHVCEYSHQRGLRVAWYAMACTCRYMLETAQPAQCM